jgi:hypothetical protein
VPTVARQAEGARWSTGAFVGSPLVREGSGLERGFDLYDAPDSRTGTRAGCCLRPRPAATVARERRDLDGGAAAEGGRLGVGAPRRLTALPFSLDDMKTSADDVREGGRGLDPSDQEVLEAIAKRPGAEIVVRGRTGSTSARTASTAIPSGSSPSR